MPADRSSGVLLHPTSLPGAWGIGDFGPGAFDFVDFLASGGQRIWQVLPLGPTGYGDSPYQCLSAFAGNPLLISLDRLIEDGLLATSEAGDPDTFGPGNVEFSGVIAHRRQIWPFVLARFEAAAHPATLDRFDRFSRLHADWLDDFALFMAVKDAQDQRPWTEWEPGIARREPSAIERWSRDCRREIRLHKLLQFLFLEQWERIRAACQARSIQLMGDLPLFVAHDSADVWARRELFHLDADGVPITVAGVPPDYFSATGQLWGNPHYRWDVVEQTGFAWWIQRFRSLLALVDTVRIDHFRGFEAAWWVPQGAATAMNGEWVKGPGAAIFDAVRSALKTERLPFVAENLGVITPEVESLRARFGLPGMAILQFAFGDDPQASNFKPHNYSRNLVVYTGTHDNDTTVGWWSGAVGHSTRAEATVSSEREHARNYLGLDGRDVHWEFIRAVLASVAALAIVPAQDVLGLGSEARMNRPGSTRGNWQWRLLDRRQLSADVARRLAKMTEMYERV
jgi:4-alpha-glucanotransferase